MSASFGFQRIGNGRASEHEGLRFPTFGRKNESTEPVYTNIRGDTRASTPFPDTWPTGYLDAEISFGSRTDPRPMIVEKLVESRGKGIGASQIVSDRCSFTGYSLDTIVRKYLVTLRDAFDGCRFARSVRPNLKIFTFARTMPGQRLWKHELGTFGFVDAPSFVDRNYILVRWVFRSIGVRENYSREVVREIISFKRTSRIT